MHLVQAARRLRIRKLADLTTSDIQDFINVLKGGGLLPRTIRMAQGAIRVSLNTAVEQKKLLVNPAMGAKLPRHTRHKMRFLQLEEWLFGSSPTNDQDPIQIWN